eukprot:gene1990-1498_t
MKRIDSIINPLENYLISKTTTRKVEKVISGTVARLYFASSKRIWENKKAGYLLIIKSKIHSNNFKLRLISFEEYKIIYESDILPNSKLEKLSTNFYSLACRDFLMGICFAEETNFESFIQILESKTSTTLFKIKNFQETISKNFLSPRRKEPETPKFQSPKKLNISNPKNVKHTFHIGSDSNHNFMIDEIPDDWKKFFEKVGINENELKAPETANVVLSSMEIIKRQHTVKNSIPQAPIAKTDLFKMSDPTPNSDNYDFTTSIRNVSLEDLKKVKPKEKSSSFVNINDLSSDEKNDLQVMIFSSLDQIRQQIHSESDSSDSDWDN